MEALVPRSTLVSLAHVIQKQPVPPLVQPSISVNVGMDIEEMEPKNHETLIITISRVDVWRLIIVWHLLLHVMSMLSVKRLDQENTRVLVLLDIRELELLEDAN